MQHLLSSRVGQLPLWLICAIDNTFYVAKIISWPIWVVAQIIERVNSYKYLSVWITFTLNWSTCISEVCTRARRHIGTIYRKFYGHTSSSTLLLTFVRPLLEYAALVWDPHQLARPLIHWTEYRNFKFVLRMCMRDWDADYATLLESCYLPTLASRRCYLKLCFLYQVIWEEISL